MPLRSWLSLIALVVTAAGASGCWFSSQSAQCAPATCAERGANCGSIDDGCGGTLECGTCADPQTCGGGGTPNVCGCAPATCAERGANCGAIDDGCGGRLECGTCVLPQTCGGDGTSNNLCGCTPTDCFREGFDCGPVPDGCGGTLQCGTCQAPQTCGGAGRANVCGCTPTSCAAVGANCGPVADGCGGTLDCGTCVAPQTCGGGGQANVCGCTPTSCAAQGASCGPIADGCGGMLDCGPCPRCGDGHIDAGEQCDDGNTSGGDGCEANCEVSVFCPAIPSAPTTGLAPGTATGSFTLNVPINRTITWVQAAFVPVPNTTSFQLILSNDPQLCHTLVNRKQYLETPCDDLCSVCASCSRNNVGQYAYLTARFEQSMPAGSTVSDMPFVDLHSNVVGFGLRMAVDDAITPASQALTGQVELCSSKYGATGTARFHATLCAGGLPINN